MKLITSIRMLLVLTVLTGIAYPLVVTGIADVLSNDAAHGSMLIQNGEIRGSALLAQKTSEARYFWPRPSAGEFATVASGASNYGPSSPALKEVIAQRRSSFGADAPADLLTASASGLDPHISPEAAMFQVRRVAAARGVDEVELKELIAGLAEPPQFGILGEPRVNVLRLNLALDAKIQLLHPGQFR